MRIIITIAVACLVALAASTAQAVQPVSPAGVIGADWLRTDSITLSGDPAPAKIVTTGTTLSWSIKDVISLPPELSVDRSPVAQNPAFCQMKVRTQPQKLNRATDGTWVGNRGLGAVLRGYTSAAATTPALTMGSESGADVQFWSYQQARIEVTFDGPGYYAITLYVATDACATAAGVPVSGNVVGQDGGWLVAKYLVQAVIPAVAATPETGWYYDPSQNGRGFAIQLNPATSAGFVGLFGYSSDGRADWYVSDCKFDMAARSCTGLLKAFNSGPTLGDYTGPVATPTGIAGNFSVTWPAYDGTAASNRQATMTFGGNVRSVIRYPLPGTSETNGSASSDLGKDAGVTTGWYLGQGESGRGYFIETTRTRNAAGVVTGFALYGVGFMYRADGSPTWFVFTNIVNGTAPTRVLEATPLLEFGGGTAFSDASGNWIAPNNVPTGSPGNVTLSMGNTATLYLPGQRGKVLDAFVPYIK